MKIESRTQSLTGCCRRFTVFYDESNKDRPFKEIIVSTYPNGYTQVVINGEWGYTDEWFDSHGNHQKFEHDVITEGRPGDIGKLKSPSKYIIDSYRNIYNGIELSKEEYIRMQHGDEGNDGAI